MIIKKTLGHRPYVPGKSSVKVTLAYCIEAVHRRKNNNVSTKFCRATLLKVRVSEKNELDINILVFLFYIEKYQI